MTRSRNFPHLSTPIYLYIHASPITRHFLISAVTTLLLVSIVQTVNEENRSRRYYYAVSGYCYTITATQGRTTFAYVTTFCCEADHARAMPRQTTFDAVTTLAVR